MLWLMLSALAAPPSPPVHHIVGGHPVDDAAWPAVAALFNNSTFACSGTLIAPDVVLTAGHCGTRLTHVLLDTIDIDQPGERIDIDRIEVHRSHRSTYDVALLFLERPAITAPTPLARDCRLDGLANGSGAIVAGFGASDELGTLFDGLLRSAPVSISVVDCDSTRSGCNAAVMPGGEAIAGGEGIDSCSGDSGGPLFLHTADGDFLFGVTSRAALPSSRPCGGGGIYTRVDAIIDWIELSSDLVFEPVECSDMANNHAPTLSVSTVSVRAGTAVSFPIHAADADGDTLVLSVSMPPQHTTVTLDGSQGLLTAGRDYTGLDSFVLSARDDGSPSLITRHTVNVLVQPAQADPDTEQDSDTEPNTDIERDSDTEQDSDTERNSEVGPPAPKSCSASPAAPSALWVLLALSAWARRRYSSLQTRTKRDQKRGHEHQVREQCARHGHRAQQPKVGDGLHRSEPER